MGRVLSEGGGLGYVHEPFNLTYAGSWLRHRPAHWYQYVDEADEQSYADDVAAVLRCRYPLTTRMREARRHRDVLTVAKQQALAARYRLGGRPLLLKDPLALFATPWLVRRFGVRPVVLVRHPAAFASSLRRLGWNFEFRHLADQHQLVELLPDGLQRQLADAATHERPVLDQAALLWNVLYSVVSDWRSAHEDWVIVRHEDLAADPAAAFRGIFESLGVGFGSHAESIVRATDVEGGGEVPIERRHDTVRNAAEAASAWHRHLSDEEIKGLRSSTEEIASAWYPPSSWTAVSR